MLGANTPGSLTFRGRAHVGRQRSRAARTVQPDVASPYFIRRGGAEGRDCETLIPQSGFDCRFQHQRRVEAVGSIQQPPVRAGAAGLCLSKTAGR
eukprot:IDg4159t1